MASGQAAVQDEASQLAALALTRVEPHPARRRGSRDRLWLDLCAGPGGKARLLAALAAARGARLVASDLRPHRARRVLGALRAPSRAGLTPAVVVADGLPRPVAAGHVRSRAGRRPLFRPGLAAPASRGQVAQDPGDVLEPGRLQRGLLNAAMDSVRPGGVVAYVTCSPHVAETRDVVTAVADRRGDVTILDAPAVLAEVPGLRAPIPGSPSSGRTATAPTPSSSRCSVQAPRPLWLALRRD